MGNVPSIGCLSVHVRGVIPLIPRQFEKYMRESLKEMMDIIMRDIDLIANKSGLNHELIVLSLKDSVRVLGEIANIGFEKQDELERLEQKIKDIIVKE